MEGDIVERVEDAAGSSIAAGNTRPSSLLLRILALALVVGEIAVFVAFHKRIEREGLPANSMVEVQAAVPELSRQRHSMLLAEEAIRAGNGDRAVEILRSLDFGDRAVEQYRLYFLANAEELRGERAIAREILGTLWRSRPTFVAQNDVAFHLGDLYSDVGDSPAAATALMQLAETRPDGEAASLAARRALREFVFSGDPSGVLRAAEFLAVEMPDTEEGRTAFEVIAALGGRLSVEDELRRLVRLSRVGDPDEAAEAIDAWESRVGRRLVRSVFARADLIARTGRPEDADKLAADLSSNHPMTVAVHSWRWWKDAADTIEERAWRTVRYRRRTGSERVRVGGRWVNRSVYRTLTRRVRRGLGRTDRRRLAAVNVVLADRAETLLRHTIDRKLEIEVHRRLARLAEKPRRQEAFEKSIAALVAVDSQADDFLQKMWDEGWTAWVKHDLTTARERFAFIFRTYRRPNIQRQARYWYARCLEEGGEESEAARHFAELVNVPYDDLYGLLAGTRVVEPNVERIEQFVPFRQRPDDWVASAESNMPDELRLAWELSILGLNRDSRAEIRANSNETNRTWAYSILARIHQSESAPLLVAHTLRQAYHSLGTVEQDRVPVHFLRMYYPTRFHEHVDKQAAEFGVDASLVKALILQESGYDPAARSRVGATGLMQIMPPTGREMAGRLGRRWDQRGLQDPAYNIELGTFYLGRLLEQLGNNPILTLAAYNGGPGNVQKWLRRDLKGRAPDEIVDSIPFNETRGYVKRVILYRSVYRRMAM